MTDRKIALKSILWLLVGIWVTVSLARFVRGLGATTNLSDSTPWGLWIAFDVMSGVALAAGGFIIAAVVYIFHLTEYKVFARPAILTAFLGYVAVAVGLLYDLGVPFNIWHPAVYPQLHSVLFEVAMCVMLYLTVLFLEFCPVILEHSRFNGPVCRNIHAALKRVTIPLVILGIVLSTLHQSSLGSLFLIVPDRVHPLWYSPILWILFFISAVGLGLMMVASETIFSSWYFGHKLRVDLLSNLGRAASIVLFLYAGLRIGDLAVRRRLDLILDGTWQAGLFIFEILLAAILPATLMCFRKVRSSGAGIGIASSMTILGMVGYRFNLCIVSFARPDGVSYFPTWMEFAVTIGIVASAMLVFIFFVERFNVALTEHEEGTMEAGGSRDRSFTPLSLRVLLPESHASIRRYSLAFIAGAAVAAAALPGNVWRGTTLLRTPVYRPMILNGSLKADPKDPQVFIYRISAKQQGADRGGADTTQFLILDGNRNGLLVAFPHQFHREKLGGDASCALCHHEAMPFDQNTPCYNCHRDMYLATDLFSHSSHISKLGENQSCGKCHLHSESPKTRETAKACRDCHLYMVQDGSIIAPKEKSIGSAAGYMEAMHGLCITCHEQKLAEAPQDYPKAFADCATCHRDIDGSHFLRMSPYTTDQSNVASAPAQLETIHDRPDYEN
jgi:Ni/Fe-hydrogenase subunit HybB-like protein